MTKTASDKVLHLLYNSTVSQASNRTALVIKEMQRSAGMDLQGFLTLDKNAFANKSMETVLDDINVDIKSNILKFKCSNCLISSTDFYNLYPRPNERRYRLPEDLKNGIRFTSLKARYPQTLSFADAYYLIFPNRLHAATYYMETQKKAINGVPLSLKFVAPKLNDVSFLHSPLIDFKSSISDTKQYINTSEMNESSASHLVKLMESSDPHSYTKILQFIDIPGRKSTVLVKNLPLGISPSALCKLLWDYDFPVHIPLDNCFKQVESDALKQVHVMLIRFADEDNANRFVRSFHGTKWQGLMKSEVTKLHEPLLCETLI